MVNKKKINPNIEALEKAILDLHGCKAKWVESVPVKEVFEGETAWEGIVEVFGLENHPAANRAYAWSHSAGHSRRRKYYAVLHQGPVKSGQDAVRAAIVNEFGKNKNGM